jgi:hypothetical protein
MIELLAQPLSNIRLALTILKQEVLLILENYNKITQCLSMYQD